MKLGKYRHFKGGICKVITEAEHTETSENLVIYRDETGEVLAISKDMFLEEVDKPEYDYKGPRFLHID